MSDETPTREELVYVIQHEHGYVKIGRTNNLSERLQALQIGSPYHLDVIGIITTDVAAEVESAIHDEFADKCVRGEWFNLNYHEISELLAMCEIGGELKDDGRSQPLYGLNVSGVVKGGVRPE